MVSPSRSARSSSSFVQYTVLSSQREIPASLKMQPRGRSQNEQHVAPRKAIDTNIGGVIPSSRSSTQVALLTCGARGEKRAHEFLHLLYIQGPWAVRIVVDDAVFKSPRTLVHQCKDSSRSVPSDSVNIIISVVCKLFSYSRKHRLLPSIPSPEVQKQRFTEHAKRVQWTQSIACSYNSRALERSGMSVLHVGVM